MTTKTTLAGLLFLLAMVSGCSSESPATAGSHTHHDSGAGGDGDGPASTSAGSGGGSPACPDGNDAKCDGCEDGHPELALVTADDGAQSLALSDVPFPLTDACVDAWFRTTDGDGSRVRGQLTFGPNGLDFELRCTGDAVFGCGARFGRSSPSGFGYLDLHAPVQAGWHHVAACVHGEAYYSDELMAHAAVYVDGQKIDEDGFHAIGDVATAGSRSMSGEISGTGAIDELRFSSGWRYPDHPGQADSFPLERHHAVDASTIALYHFDGTLEDAAPGKHDIESDGTPVVYEVDTGYRPELCQ